jgi:gliding motility associated protien GldN
MKPNLALVGSCIVTACLFAMDASAQRTSRRRNTNNASTQPATTNPAGEQQQEGNNNQPQPVDPGQLKGLPITYDTAGVNGTPLKSTRPDNLFGKPGQIVRTPLPYEHIRWDDALYAEKVWRELDLREKMNKAFTYEAEDDNGSQIFVNMLMRAVQNGEVTAFADDRFTTPMTVADVQQLTAGQLDTNYVTAINDIEKIVGINISRKSFDAKSIKRIRLKEEWVFDRESSRMVVRILGIGLLKTELIPGTNKERGTSNLFWVHYPDLRPMLVNAEVYNPKNMGQSRMTWEELFESRMFSSYIVKSTIDNPGNKMIRNYITDPILRLMEGENIKEKIFNFEQDLWSY